MGLNKDGVEEKRCLRRREEWRGGYYSGNLIGERNVDGGECVEWCNVHE